MRLFGGMLVVCGWVASTAHASRLGEVAPIWPPFPNARQVVHEIVIDNLGDYPDHVFFVHPVEVDHVFAAPIKAHESLRIDEIASGRIPHLFAIPRSLVIEVGPTDIPESWFDETNPAVRKSEMSFRWRRYARQDNQLARSVSKYRIELSDRLILRRVANQSFDENGDPIRSGNGWVTLGGLGAAGILFAVIYDIRKARIARHRALVQQEMTTRNL